MQIVWRIAHIAAVTACIALAFPAFCQWQHTGLFTFRHPAMGTEFVVYLYAQDEAEAGREANEVFEEIDRIEQELSNYRESSELSRINRKAALTTVTTDPETFRFLQSSQHWSAASNGAFDISVGR